MEFVEWHGGKIAGARKFSTVLPFGGGGHPAARPGEDTPAMLEAFRRFGFACGFSAGLEACHYQDKRLRAHPAALRCGQTRAPAPQPNTRTMMPFQIIFTPAA